MEKMEMVHRNNDIFLGHEIYYVNIRCFDIGVFSLIFLSIPRCF